LEEVEKQKEELRAEVNELTRGLTREDLQDPSIGEEAIRAMESLRLVNERMAEIIEELLARRT